MSRRCGTLAAVLTINALVLFITGYALMGSFGRFGPSFSPTYVAVAPAGQEPDTVSCTRAAVADPALAALCDRLVQSQRLASGEHHALLTTY